VRRVLIGIEHEKFGRIFQERMSCYIKEEDKKLAHLVSFFSSDSKEILMDTKSNKIPQVQEMY